MVVECISNVPSCKNHIHLTHSPTNVMSGLERFANMDAVPLVRMGAVRSTYSLELALTTGTESHPCRQRALLLQLSPHGTPRILNMPDASSSE